jgi:hypothetical protein
LALTRSFFSLFFFLSKFSVSLPLLLKPI